jgi:hypothetical protein
MMPKPAVLLHERQRRAALNEAGLLESGSH